MNWTPLQLFVTLAAIWYFGYVVGATGILKEVRDLVHAWWLKRKSKKPPEPYDPNQLS